MHNMWANENKRIITNTKAEAGKMPHMLCAKQSANLFNVLRGITLITTVKLQLLTFNVECPQI